MMLPEPQRAADASLKMIRTNSETSNLRTSREKIGLRGRSKSLSVRFADGVSPGNGRNKPSCSVLVPPHHRISTVYTDKEHYAMVQEEPMEVIEDSAETASMHSGSSSRSGSGRGWFRGRHGSPPPPHHLSQTFHHSSLELSSPQVSVERRESRVRMLLKGVGSFFRYSKRKFRLTSASFADDGGSSLRDGNPRAVRRTHSDVGGTGGRSCLHYSRQLSTPQPIKIRPAHRLPQHTASLHRSKSLKRSKGSSHLRRSISQPLDLDKAYESPSSHKCTSPTHAHNRRQRRPSAGNILNDDIITSEDEIGISDSEDFRTDLKRSLDEDDDMIVYAEALWDHVTLDSEELVFKAGDLITVIDSSDKDWWWGRISHRVGWFPAAFVRILVNQEDHQNSRSHDDTRILGPVRKLSVSGLSHDQIRTNVINEIISTERDFVKHLRDVVKGYLRQVRKRPDMFSDERISTIFGNMEALYQFQSNFLRELELCIDWQDPHKSCIGAAFIRNREKFEIYSEYCNNHPAAMSSLQELYQHQKYIHFFEACRLLQEMIDISLDGFLLTPVQKICKYPLQLQELLKYTKPDHPDYTSVQGALEAMRDVALLVNERKRRMECLEKIASWQITVEGWEGPELLEDSSQLIYQGEVTKGAGGSWPKEVTLFLFDHQLVYCKRDLLKRNTFVYRGRLNLDMCEIVDLSDGKDSSLNISVHNAWKIHSLEKNKWYVFSCKTAAEKHKWMEAFRRERELVAADERAGFVVADKAKHLAKVAARNQRNRPKRPRTTKSHKRVQAMTYAQAELLVNVDPEIRSNSLPSGVQPPEGKKKGLWFSFGGHKKGRGSGRNVTQIQHHPV
ncbi:rho guanine nucleotide exchange factor 9 isoform X3 [Procambarus clarkii]|uniref:rho guanine nucleotide exchange factor 9 isoform X3 n=1 Tax=Procambarus clarkii TaxID=6728 RepID=UPI001E672A78|nr:rho guanine nucleotide exchange factor 9-like isoform X3 [Procambarus clarkii]